MQYTGGKYKLAQRLSKTMLGFTPNRQFYLEPFVGGASVLDKMAPHFKFSAASDINRDIVEYWIALQNGWEPPSHLSRQEYNSLKKAEPSPLRTFAGFGCSFGGKWFGGYAQGSYDDYATVARRTSLKKVSHFQYTQFHVCDYRDWEIEPGYVIYCDPPYENTLSYGNYTLDHDIFWDTMEAWSKLGAIVFVSELIAPSNWKPIWTVERRVGYLDSLNGQKEMKTDSLWVYDG